MNVKGLSLSSDFEALIILNQRNLNWNHLNVVSLMVLLQHRNSLFIIGINKCPAGEFFPQERITFSAYPTQGISGEGPAWYS